MLFARCSFALRIRRGAAAEESPPDRVSIGARCSYESTRSEAIRLALRELGHIEGQNIAIEYRYAEGKRIGSLSSRPSWCVSRLISSWYQGTEGSGRLRMRPRRFLSLWWVSRSDPVEAGLVDSLARPGGNVTGLTNLTRELVGKQLELLKEAVPKLVRVAVLYDPANPASVLEVKEVLPVAARALRLNVRSWEVRGADDFDRVFAALNKQRPDGLYVLGGPLMAANGKRIAGFAIKSRLPSVYYSREAVDAGGLMYYGADLADSYRRVAYFVDRILKGAKPADLPVEQPTKFELVINLKTAKQISVIIPPDLLARATRIIR